jgi:hypothetical protein
LGYSKTTTPFLSSLSERSIVFSGARSPAPNSMFSLRSSLSGQTPSMILESRGESIETLAHELGRRGFRTGAAFDQVILGGQPAETLGFQFHFHERESDQVLPILLKMILAAGESPYFVWGHVMDPHAPYIRHDGPDFGGGAIGNYDSEIHHTDQKIKEFLADVERLASLTNTVVVISADHGESFGEQGEYFHGTSLSEAQIRVPLLIRIPGLKARRIDTPVCTGSIAATITDILGLPALRDEAYPSLLPLMLDVTKDEEHFAVSERYSAMTGAGRRSLRSIQSSRLKMTHDLRTGFRTLYDTVSDPMERRELSS